MDFWEFFWIIVMTFVFFAYLMMLFSIFADIFRDHELGGEQEFAALKAKVLT